MSFERVVRSFIPSTVILARNAAAVPVFWIVDLVARPFLRLFTKEAVPPLRLIIRTGVANKIFFPHFYYLTASRDIWLYFLARGLVNFDSRIVDIGSGVGKSAVSLREFRYFAQRFEGHYYGYDVDHEMVAWCQKNFPKEHFTFTLLDMQSRLYNPGGMAGSKPRLNCDCIDLVFSQSLFSHLLEDDVRHYCHEAHRCLRPGGTMSMTFFCLEDMEELGLIGGRWTFKHNIGAASVENIEYPESAVAYKKEWIIGVARGCGFSSARVILPDYQSTLECVK